MEITARQLSRIEAACTALATHTQHNEVGTVLVNLIREQLAEIEVTASPTVPGPGATAVAGKTEEIRSYGRELIREGTGLIPAIRMIRARFGMSHRALAKLLGTSKTIVTSALSGVEIRPILLCRMAEVFGEGEEA